MLLRLRPSMVIFYSTSTSHRPNGRIIISETVHGERRDYFMERTRLETRWAAETSNTTDEKSSRRSLFQQVRKTFLPVGYPASVHSAYSQIHVYQFIENMAGSAISVLTAQAMLSAVGATAPRPTQSATLAVAIDWALKDGFGEIGKMLFIRRFAHQFDTRPKRWKMVGEVCSVMGAFLQMCTCLVSPQWFLLFASAGVGLRAIHFSVWSATHTTFTRNLSSHSVNVGDIVAKDDSQLSLAHILGMAMGIGLLSLCHEPLFLFSCFTGLSLVQLLSTLRLVQSARFEVLEQTRLLLLPREYIKSQRVPSMSQVAPMENWLNEGLKRHEQKLPLVSIGVSVRSAFSQQPQQLQIALSVLKYEQYLIAVTQDGRYSIVLGEESRPMDVLKAMFHVSRIHSQNMDHEMLLSSYQWVCTHFADYVEQVHKNKWRTDMIVWEDNGIRAKWSNA